MDEFEIIKTYYLKERSPYLLSSNNENNKTTIKNFSKELPLSNKNKLKITYEHYGHCFPETHINDVFSRVDTTSNVLINIIKFNSNNNWYIETINSDCVKLDKTTNTITRLRKTDGCHINKTIIDDNSQLQEYDFDCIVFGESWCDGFQHAFQNVIPYMNAIKDWLIENPHIKIVCYNNPEYLWWNKKYLNINNDFIFTTKNYISSTKNLYTVIQNPKNICEMVPYVLYSNLNIINQNCEDRFLVVFDRRMCDARIIDYSILFEILKHYLLYHRLELKIIDPSVYSREYLIKIMNNCRGVIAPHGGANYNVIFMRRTLNSVDKKRFFIEFVVNKGLHHTYHIALGAKINYQAILCEGEHLEKNMKFDKDEFIETLNKFLPLPLK